MKWLIPTVAIDLSRQFIAGTGYQSVFIQALILIIDTCGLCKEQRFHFCH